MPETHDRSLPPGLCATCNSAPSCMYLRQRPLAVWHCTEFDDRTPRAPQAVLAPLPVAGPTRYQGLCDDCAQRPGCHLPSRSEGVWRCEEYR